METWYDKNVLPSKMIFQLYDPSLVLLKDFFFLSFHLFPLLFNKLNVISDWAYSFLFGCCWISLQRNCTCWSFDQITPALFFMLHFAPLVNSNRARNEREWKIYRPPSHRPGFNINLSEITFSTFSLKILYYQPHLWKNWQNLNHNKFFHSYKNTWRIHLSWAFHLNLKLDLIKAINFATND